MDLRKIINDKFWEKQIIKQEYLLWDPSLPRAKIFFANYFYQKGFGRHPMLPKKIAQRRRDINFIPYPKKESLVFFKNNKFWGCPR